MVDRKKEKEREEMENKNVKKQLPIFFAAVINGFTLSPLALNLKHNSIFHLF